MAFFLFPKIKPSKKKRADLSGPFGKFSSSILEEESGMVFQSSFQSNARLVSVEGYADYYAFMKAYQKIQKTVLIK